MANDIPCPNCGCAEDVTCEECEARKRENYQGTGMSAEEYLRRESERA